MRAIASSTSFFFNDTATTEIYTLSLHDALPIYEACPRRRQAATTASQPDRTTLTTMSAPVGRARPRSAPALGERLRSEEHTSELQSRQYLVCRPLLEKKNCPRSSSSSSSALWYR